MPQVQINSQSIIDFGFDVTVDIYNRTIKFNTASLTNFEIDGNESVLGVAFHVEDSVGLELMTVDWDAPHITPSDDEDEYILDLSSSPLSFLFQKYKIIGYIKDEDGTVYQTVEILIKICQPKDITEMGYVPGDFEIIPDCINDNIVIKEFTPLIYDNEAPESVTKLGTLSYPSGTIAALSFASTPFSNDVVYTGEYRVNCTTVGRYDIGDNVYVLVTYLTNRAFPVTCSNFIGDITCCLTDVYNTYQKNCENATGQAALQKYNSVLPSILNGLVKQINGQDASREVADIKKILNCDCGKTSLRHNEETPTNPSIYSIVLNGVGGTTIGAPTITGNTKTYNIASKTYVVGKGDTGDLAYTIAQSIVGNVVTYKITFNYDNMAGYILDAIEDNPTLINQLNSLVTAAGSIVGLDGKCIIDLTQSNYSVSQAVGGSTVILNIVINGVIYTAPISTFADNATLVDSWLNSLTLGTFTAVVNGGILTIQSVNNTNTLSTVSFTGPSLTRQFSSTNATLVQVLQALVDYVCNLTALQVALGNNLNLCTFDYSGNIVETLYIASVRQSDFNSGVASSICMIVSRINTLTGVTCDKLKEIFIDRSGVTFGAEDRIYGTLGGDCAGLTDLQMGNLFIDALNKYGSLRDAWNLIDFEETSSSCPDIDAINVSIVSGKIAIYGVTFDTATVSTKVLTVKYRVNGTLLWNVATSGLQVFANGNVSGVSPYLITAVSPGITYDVQIINNCGGIGAITQVTTPTSSVYGDDYYLDSSIYTICGATPVALYSSSPFAVGVIMYEDIGLTTPVTGFTYITKLGANIHQLNTSTGVVGTNTGSSCDNGTAASYILGNDTGTICGLGPVTLYTDGDFAVGKTLYTDPSLVTPQTAFSYVVYDWVIYNKSTVTGAVTSSTGLSCAGAGGSVIMASCGIGNDIQQMRFNGTVIGVTGGYPVEEGDSVTAIITGAAPNGTLAIDIVNHTGGTNSRIDIIDSNGNVACLPIGANGTITFTLVDIVEGLPFSITVVCDGICA